ncbi:ABC transporter ATP-binding protein [Thiomicrorhabdus sp. zzn3]|uniref:ABC transporter ATP-binding protein n=1 Tax=Thiomicrorhabdus sp. zzn3 TaxID=3039775 RepID=UPI00243743D5|nr:ABC transporter ATP-binding protein [Thiomicrorhabdus sp. zzn3]MDG6777727.1 ABC transporter ATP-binding protein [Thiomicrorhabdus sp. zzn3]
MTSQRAPNPPPLIQLQSVTKCYGSGAARSTVLKNIDLTIQQGEFVAIMGHSGSGKSTTLNILGCLDTPTSGAYQFDGLHVESMTTRQRALLRRYYLGFVFQGFNLLNRTSALENVELPLIYRGLSIKERRNLALQALQSVGLETFTDHTPGELSGGQQQRVAIARAIVTQPKVLLADEPTGNLDSRHSHEIMQILSQLNQEQGITIIMVTHEEEMAAYADRRILFKDGQIVSQQGYDHQTSTDQHQITPSRASSTSMEDNAP